MLLITDANMYKVAWLIINNVFVEDQITWQRNTLIHAYGSQLFTVSFPLFVWFSLTSPIKFADLNTPYLIKNNKSKQCMSVFNSWWMLLGLTFNWEICNRIPQLSVSHAVRSTRKKLMIVSLGWDKKNQRRIYSPQKRHF